VDTNGGPATANLTGTGTPAIASLSPQVLAFNPQPLFTSSAPQTVTLTNISGAPLQLTSIAAADNFLATSSCPSTLDSGASCVINVTFAPSLPTADSGFLSIGTSLGTVTAILSVNHRTIRVPADAPSINQAVFLAQDGDTVLVAPGTYFEQISFQGKAITIAGAGGAAATTLDGNGFSTPVFVINGEGPRSVLKGFTITHGSNGGVAIFGASPTLQDNIITGNTGCNGGGVEVTSSSAVLLNNTISNNSVPTFCNFNASGGGIQVTGFGQNGPVQITGNTITGNQVPFLQGGGGGISVVSGRATITGNTIQGNFTAGNGGGIWVAQGSVADLVQNLITGNSANVGGGIYHAVDFSPSQILNNTISGNSAFTASAAFIDGFDAGVSLTDNLLIDNTGIGAVACGFSGGQVPSFSFNDVFSAGQPNLAYTLACQDMTGTNGNIKQDPQFVDPNRDYHLSAPSPAVDAGNPFIGSPFGPAALAAPTLDLDGKGRIGPGNVSTCTGVIDMGAYEFALNATGTVAPLPATWDFGPAFVGTTGFGFNFPVNVQGCVQVASVKTTGDFQQTNDCGNAASSAGCGIVVTFVPTNSGLRTGTLTVDFGSSSPAQTVALTGQAQGASIFASPSSLLFPDQQLQTSSPSQSIGIFAFNQQALINAIWITGDFAQTSSCTNPTVSGMICTISIVFAPTATGPRSGALTVSSNHGTLVIPLSGTGTGSPIASISPTALAFPDQPVNAPSSAQLATLTNTGTGTLLPQAFTITGDFTVTPSPACQPGLNPGQSCTYSFIFKPIAPGLRTGTFSLQTNAGNVSISLSGTGLAAVASVSPQTLSFAGQILQTSSTAQTVTLANSGNLPLAIAGITTNGDFAQSNNCGTSLAAGTACSINVTFTPTAIGNRSGNLAVATNAGSFSVSLSGFSATATATANPQSLAFGSELTNVTSGAQAVTVTAGINPLQISAISASGDFAQTNNCGATLAPAISCSIRVTFTPSAPGLRSGVLTVNSNESSLAVPLSGTGLVRDPNAIYVPVDQGTIQAAINAAANGQTVLVLPGTYFEHVDFLGKAITVASTDGASATIIDGSTTGTVVTFKTGEGPASILSGFTITHGTSTFEGAGIMVSTASPTIQNNIITANQGCQGIGVGVGFGSPIIQNNTISNNIQKTCSGGNGGGISVRGASAPQILNNTIAGNQLRLGGDGGGISVNAASPIVSRNIIGGNTVFNDGGGISSINGGTPKIIENLITGNTSINGNGGGIYWGSGAVVVSNTVAGNSALAGSAVFADALLSGTEVVNNILVGSPGATAFQCNGQFGTTPPIVSFNDAFSNGGSGYGGTCASLAGTAGNISLDPQFVDAVNGNYHLQAASPAIDAGNSVDPNLPGADLDGNPRIAFGNAATCVNAVDLGVYEFFLTTPAAAAISPSTFDFGTQPVGTSSSAQVFTVTASQGCVLVGPVSATGDFSQTNNCSSVLATGASCTVQVKFTPTAGGLRSGSLNIPAGNSTLVASLTGTGGVAIGTLTPASLSFGGQFIGTTSAAQSVTLTNTGNIALIISGVTATGDFAQSNSCPATLAAGASCVIQVSFTPTGVGGRTGSLVVSDNDPASSQTTVLTGTGLDYSVSASPSSATVRAGSAAAYTVTVAALGGSLTNSVNLSCGVLPVGATCTFSPSAVAPGAGSASSSLRLNTSNGERGTKKTPRGTYTISIIGISGGLTRTTIVTLVVQ
jgi:HYDIN/CFA65/VesB family protein/parallel beta helix pectate lyase-like protein